MATMLTVLHPVPAAGADTFNMTYYFEKHMPLTESAWTKYGLLKWSTVKLAPETGYVVQSVLIWESAQSLEKALKEAGAEIMGDRENFSTENPVILHGAIAAGNLQ